MFFLLLFVVQVSAGVGIVTLPLPLRCVVLDFVDFVVVVVVAAFTVLLLLLLFALPMKAKAVSLTVAKGIFGPDLSCVTLPGTVL